MKTKFNYFEEAETDQLRFWNIAVTLSNLREDFGDEVATEYVSNLSKLEINCVSLVYHTILKKGLDEARKEILGFTPVKDGSIYDNRVRMDAPESESVDA